MHMSMKIHMAEVSYKTEAQKSILVILETICYYLTHFDLAK